MGLAEKRAAAQLKDERVPYYQNYLDGDLGFTIKLEVDTDSMSEDLKAMNYVYSYGLDNVYYALKYIGTDNIGKDALKSTIQTVRMVNIPVEQKKYFELKDGTLTVYEPYASDTYDDKYHYSALQAELEQKL